MVDHEFNLVVKVHTTIARKYRFAIVRGVSLHLQSSKLTFGAKRAVGHSNLDLYLDEPFILQIPLAKNIQIFTA